MFNNWKIFLIHLKQLLMPKKLITALVSLGYHQSTDLKEASLSLVLSKQVSIGAKVSSIFLFCFLKRLTVN